MPGSVIDGMGELARRRTAPLILELDLTEGVLPQPPTDPVGRAVSRRRPALGNVVEALRQARDDARVKGVVVRLGGHRLGLATAQELRAALTEFQEAGKWALAWSESFGEFGQSSVSYYLATACETVWLMPTGAVGLVGVGFDVTFLHDALDKAGVEFQVGQRHQYKNAANMFTQSSFTPAHREATERWAESCFDQLVGGIASARRLDPQAVKDAIDDGPLLAHEAKERGLVDRLGYRDEVYDDARARAGERARLVFLHRYRKHGEGGPVRKITKRRQPVIALVHATGAIRVGRSGRSPISGRSMGSDTVSAALRAATRSDAVRAIVLRVDSPGGSAVASDVIWRSVVLARRAGKPVVVSMGDVAGSGGYYISMAADTIVADPGTLTGSIGVLSGKPVLAELLARAGVTTERVLEGRHAGMFSTRFRYGETEWERLQVHLDKIYDDFVGKVAEGRGMSRAAVHEVAKGRIWSGADAIERGLVDQLGGLELAIELARERGRLAAGKGAVREFPRLRPIDRVRPARSSEDPAAAAVSLAQLQLEAWGPLAGLARALGLPDAGPLTMAFVPTLA